MLSHIWQVFVAVCITAFEHFAVVKCLKFELFSMYFTSLQRGPVELVQVAADYAIDFLVDGFPFSSTPPWMSYLNVIYICTYHYYYSANRNFMNALLSVCDKCSGELFSGIDFSFPICLIYCCTVTWYGFYFMRWTNWFSHLSFLRYYLPAYSGPCS